ncbi:MAG: amidohydrolase family protein [Fibrobacteria bacterium]
MNLPFGFESTSTHRGILAGLLLASAAFSQAIAIIDTHIHIFDPSRPGGVPWPGLNSDIYRTTLPAQYDLVGKPAGVTGVVIVEASPLLEDNQWVLDKIRDLPGYHGVIGNLTPGTVEFASHLERFSKEPKYLGIRLRTARVSRAGLSAEVLRDLRDLAAKGRVLEFQIQRGDFNSLDAAMAVAEQVPDLPIMLGHLASATVDGKAPDSAWTAAIQAIAKHPKVYCKISGLVNQAAVRPSPLDSAYYQPLLDVLWGAFGSERLVYGSNWPVSEDSNEGRPGSFTAQQQLIMAYFQGKGAAAADNAMAGNAARFYRIKPASSTLIGSPRKPVAGAGIGEGFGTGRPFYSLLGRFNQEPGRPYCFTREPGHSAGKHPGLTR